MCDGKTAYRDGSSYKLDGIERKRATINIICGALVIIAGALTLWVIFHNPGLI